LSVSTDGQHSRPGSPSSFVSTASSSHIHANTIPAPYDYHLSAYYGHDNDQLDPDHADDQAEDPRQSVDSASSKSHRWKSFFSSHRKSKDSTLEGHEPPPDIVLSPVGSSNDLEQLRKKHEQAANRLSQIEDQAHLFAQLQLSEQRAAAQTAAIKAQIQPPVRPGLHDRNPSVYSNYSFYDISAEAPESPTNRRSPSPATPAQRVRVQSPANAPSRQRDASREEEQPPPGPVGTFQKSTWSARAQASDGTANIATGTTDPNELVLLGIQEHEMGNLARAITYFQKAAQSGSGHGVRLEL
jgi:hypothetical protein